MRPSSRPSSLLVPVDAAGKGGAARISTSPAQGELFRRRCRTIYCFDASSDRRTFAASLADSVALAYEELGVVIDLDKLLVIGRTTLDPRTPWWIKRYAAEHELFPYDATGDQFFDGDKFKACTALGYHVGEAVVEAKQSKERLDAATALAAGKV